MSKLKKYVHRLNNLLIEPRSSNVDLKRREFILNVLLINSVILSFAAFIGTTFIFYIYRPVFKGENPLILFFIFLFMCILLFYSRRGKYIFSANILIIFLFLLNIYTSYRWGVDSQQAILMYSLIIIMAGVLISAKESIRVAMLSASVIIIIGFMEINGIIRPDYSWKYRPAYFGEIFFYAITLGIIAIVSWLWNHEMENLLKRAWKSEDDLKQERDLLEEKVEQRTRQLKEAQLQKMDQLYRFAKFGQITSGLFHDLVNPLSLVSLNLDRLSMESKKLHKQKISDISVLINRALKGTHRLENFIEAGRRQAQYQNATKMFSVQSEINQTIEILQSKAKDSQIKISFSHMAKLKVFGNPMKFSQVVMNLLSNAIDAYDNIDKVNKNRQIKIQLLKISNLVRLTITDWGGGIPEENIDKIFDPFFTTKNSEKGIGIGLYITRDIIEKSFHGKISVKGDKHTGTIFTVDIPINYVQKR